MAHPSLIGIDGGATTCRFALHHQGQRGDVHLSGANATSSLDGAVTTLRDGLEALARQANLALEDLRSFPTFIGLAGVMDDTMARAISSALPLEQVTVEDDRRTAMVGGLGGADGCVLGIGTGSFFGRRAEGVSRLIGGWGLVLGDAASGAALGRALLGRTLEVCDGLHRPSALSRDILAEFTSAPAIVAFAATATARDFANFAPRVMEAAEAGDATARSLVDCGAQEIERMLAGLGWQPGETIIPLGGLAPHYAPYLAPEIAARMRTPKGTALDGALALAAEVAAP